MKEISTDLRSPDRDLLSLIRSKNRCLERLMEATQTLLREPVENLMVHDTDGKSAEPLADFMSARESAMKALELYDRKITDLIPSITPAMKTSRLLDEAKLEMARNEKLITALFGADEVVFARIQEAQSRIVRLSGENRRSKESLSKFKSSWITESGEEMDKTL